MRKSKNKLLFGLKVLVICGATLFTVKGIDPLYADTGNGISEKEDIVVETEPQESQGTIESLCLNSEDAYLLAKIAMAEAEGEDVKGKALVIHVVLNRVWSDKFPDSIPEVIFQERQFSPVGNGRFDRVEPNRECYEALELIQLNQWDESQGALYFESDGKSSWHRNNLHFLFQHGNHYFYTDKELAE